MKVFTEHKIVESLSDEKFEGYWGLWDDEYNVCGKWLKVSRFSFVVSRVWQHKFEICVLCWMLCVTFAPINSTLFNVTQHTKSGEDSFHAFIASRDCVEKLNDSLKSIKRWESLECFTLDEFELLRKEKTSNGSRKKDGSWAGSAGFLSIFLKISRNSMPWVLEQQILSQ